MIYVKSKNTLTILLYKNNSIKNHNLKTDKESKVATVVLGLLYDRNNIIVFAKSSHFEIIFT
jgi:hypothetical protein